MKAISVRPAISDDADAIAEVHVKAWREAYEGLLPKTLLDGLSIDHRAAHWRQMLNATSPQDEMAAYVAVDNHGGMIGFGSCGTQRSDDLALAGFKGEFQAIYVLQRAQRRGIGRKLMMVMTACLQAKSYRSGSLWVLEENHTARRFYDALDGKIIDEREDRRQDGLVLLEVAYGWRDLDVLLAHDQSAT